MKKIIVVSLLLLGACAGGGGLNFGDAMLAQNYVTGTEDLPVYKGFKAVDAKNVAYDSESGRIIDASYISDHADSEEVKTYYSQTLAQLGWKKQKPHEYVREGERLKVSITAKGGVTFLKFTIRPVA